MMPLHQISVTPLEKYDKTQRVDTKIMRSDSKEKYHVATQTPLSLAERCSSRASTLSYTRDFCRICHCEGDSDVPLISPCYCSGSLRYVHQACLQQWIKSSNIKCCELCKFTFVMQTKTKPFGMWERLDMAASERRKLLCSVTFHVVALTCVVWSLYVLIERTTEEVSSGVLGWPFWTKLIVVAIGVTGCVVFMYVQCKVYAQLCRRWRAYNRVIFVQNVPEKMPVASLERDPERGEDVTAPPTVVSDAGGGASAAEDGADWLALEGGGANSSERRESAERVTHVTIELNGGLSSVVTLPPIGQCAKSGAVTSVTDMTSPLDSAPLTSLLRSPSSADDVLPSGNDVTPSSNVSEPAATADSPMQPNESTKYPVDDGVG